MPKHIRPKAYPRPPQASGELPGQQVLFDETTGAPDRAVYTERKAVLNARLEGIKRELTSGVRSIEVVQTLLDRGVTVPDVAAALGLKAPVDRVTRPLRPWRLRRGSNMDVIATMLEDASRKGVSEDEMVAHLRTLGRLTTAGDPERSVHWTVTELQKRTRFLKRARKAKGGRWYAYGRFDTWRSAAA